jgi:ribosomal protein S18 acetylase RimI-like enzyme
MPRWDSEQVVRAFYDCKIELPETAKNSYMYFEDTFNDTKANMYEVCDICVDKNYRRKGYGKFILNNINEIAKENGRDLMITVYKDNNKAISLYTQLGFLLYHNDYDNRGIGSNPNSEYLKMIKYNVNKF